MTGCYRGPRAVTRVGVAPHGGRAQDRGLGLSDVRGVQTFGKQPQPYEPGRLWGALLHGPHLREDQESPPTPARGSRAGLGGGPRLAPCRDVLLEVGELVPDGRRDRGLPGRFLDVLG